MMSHPNLHLVSDPDDQTCAPTVPRMALADVLGASFAADALDDNALILAIAAHIEAECIFAFGPQDASHAAAIAKHRGDGTVAVTRDTSPTAANAPQGRGFAHMLKPDAIAKADVLLHVDRLHGDDARLEYAPWIGACDLVLVDASPLYDYVRCDSLTAFHLAKPGGVVLWSNYDSAVGVTQCLNALQRGYRCFRNLRRIADSHICYWRNV